MAGEASKIFYQSSMPRVTSQPAKVMQQVYGYLGVPDFRHNFEKVAQITQEVDQAYGIAGLHETRSKVEPLPTDYLSILGKDAVQYVQSNLAWYFNLFGYSAGAF